MLRHTFCHLPGIGAKTELRLWAAGLTTWEAVLAQEQARPGPLARRLPADHLRASVERYACADPAWFAQRLPAAQSWRLFRDFRGSCAYLDIETTGLAGSDHITTIALYDGRSIRCYVHGQNLPDFVRDIQAYRLLITYNGKTFDIPVIERTLGYRLEQAHIDLRYVLKGLGYSGGLKSCERQLGMGPRAAGRGPGMEDMDGFVAVLLWREFRRRKSRQALESLLAYNVQDAINLEMLMVQAHNRKLAALTHAPFAADYLLPLPALPANPFQVDGATVRRVLSENPWYFPGRPAFSP